ncbi:RS26B [Hepatospora eriocheir]|uniref:40S ribosomal protein S26 n=1 Tax=Hepatospora eriocheir TaxID=1081669 RepID=A0A1X0QJ42_9MICR|nr:RS26B [Hepatospora eriocheir]ORD99782.1 RS26B [Hepatospora eriocheir]
MPVKRANHGKNRNNRGNVSNVSCIKCGAQVPKDKAVSKSSNNAIIEFAAHADLDAASIYQKTDVPVNFIMDYYCISCAVHTGIVKVRRNEVRCIRRKPKMTREIELH